MPNVYKHRITKTATAIPPVDTTTCFNTGYVEVMKSPIDSCFEKMNNLNIIQVRFSAIPAINQDLIDTQNNLTLLGYISAVESYLREIIRRLIILDKSCRLGSLGQHVTYGAALNYPNHLLPEAMLERVSYASKANIIEAFKSFLNLKGHPPNELDTALEEYEKICHLRHCVVHRFGKLGSNNAMKFGLDQHSACLEKPLVLDSSKLYSIYQVCENTVLVINNYLFISILSRTVAPEISPWDWDFRRDRKLFKKYFDLFSSTLKGEVTSTLKTAYLDLKTYKSGL